jgi:predicted nucleic acid-binding Zn finger protein
MIGLWHAAVGDWLHGSSYMYVSCSLQSISKHYPVGAISLSSRIFAKGKVFVLINPPTNYIISITIMSCSQFLS